MSTKKEKRNGKWGIHVWWEKRESEKERWKKKIEREKTELVLFVCSYYLVQSVELWKFIYIYIYLFLS